MDSYETRHAIREANKIELEDAYFNARPQIDFKFNRNIFGAGFDRAWDKQSENSAKLEQQRDRAEQQLKQVLWDDPESAPSFGPAFGDLLSYLNRQEPFPSDLYAMMASGSRLWLQMKDKLSTIEQQRDELLAALEKITSPTQSDGLLWWQIEAREALAKVGAGATAPEGHNVESEGRAACGESLSTGGLGGTGDTR